MIHNLNKPTSAALSTEYTTLNSSANSFFKFLAVEIAFFMSRLKICSEKNKIIKIIDKIIIILIVIIIIITIIIISVYKIQE